MFNTLQDVADAMSARFTDGRGRASRSSKHGHSQCMYRTTDGKPCVVGALIPDDHPDLARITKVEDDAKFLFLKFPSLRELFAPEAFDIEFLQMAQIIHDFGINWGSDGKLNQEGRSRFSTLCTSYGVTTNV